MGKEKSTTNSSTNVQATPEETAMNKLSLERLQANQGSQLALDKQMYGAMSTVMSGGTLPGNLAGITGINEDQTQAMVQASLRDLYPQFQSAGIMDSGTAIQTASRTAADVRNANAQFNVSAISNLFNQALGGSSNLSNSTSQQTGVLGSQLAGLRSINSSSTATSMNPFLKSFQTSLGSGLGTGMASGITGGLGGGMSGMSQGLMRSPVGG
jgi:hypothetical protein